VLVLPTLAICSALASATAVAADPVATGPRLVSAAGRDELWRGAEKLGELKLATAARARGPIRVREVAVEGRPVIDLRVPVVGRSSVEAWVGLAEGGQLRAIWTGLVGAVDADGEHGRELAVGPEGIRLHESAARLYRCDGRPVRLTSQRYDFASGRLLPTVDLPPVATTVLRGRRGGQPPTERPRVAFPFAVTSLPPQGASDLGPQGLVAPAAVNDGDPRTVWLEGGAGDGQGEVLSARPAGSGHSVVGLRLAPGDTRSRQQYEAHGRARVLHLALGRSPEQQFEVVLPDDDGTSNFRQPFWVALPRPIPTSCVTITVREVRRGKDPREGEVAAWGDIDVFTDLDGASGPARLVRSLGEAGCEARVADVVALGPGALPGLTEALAASEVNRRDCLLEALAGIGVGRGRAGAAVGRSLRTALPRSLFDATSAQESLIIRLLGSLEEPATGELARQLQRHLDDAALSEEARIRMARALASLPGPTSHQALLDAAGRGPPALRVALRETLPRVTGLPGTKVLAALQAETATKDPFGARRGDLAELVGRLAASDSGLRAPAIEVLVGLAGDESQPFELRARALRGLGHVDDPEALAALARTRTSSRDPVVRLLAVRGLAASARPAALPPLRDSVADPDPAVREAAVQALGQRGDRAAAATIIGAAKQEPWPAVRRAEVAALGELCGAGAGDLFVRAVERDQDDVRRAALLGLVSCKDGRATRLSLDVLGRERETPGLRSFAAALLGRLRDPKVVPEMASALERLVVESQTDLALEATAVSTMRAMGVIGGPAAAAAALDLRGDPRPSLRRSAVETLGRVCDGKAAAALREAMNDKDQGVATAAVAGLRRCGVAAGEGQVSRP
jgi:HEAT repeat protein